MSIMKHAIAAHADFPEEAQKQAGKAAAGAMDAAHKDFLRKVLGLIADGSINPDEPSTFLNDEVYESLDPEWRKKTDLAVVNMSHLLRLIKGFHESKETPDESPQLQTMIEELWQMKERIEKHADVFIF